MFTTTFSIPGRENVSPANQGLFDKLQRGLGMVPNLYAAFAHSESALGSYLALQNRPSSLTLKEREVINLVVSQINHCDYCLAAHSLLARKAGFSEDEVLTIRRGIAPFDSKLDVLARFVATIVEGRGKVSEEDRRALFEAGYTEENAVDLVMAIGDKMITNFLFGVSEVPVDFPSAPEL